MAKTGVKEVLGLDDALAATGTKLFTVISEAAL